MYMVLCGEVHTVYKRAFPNRAKGQAGLNRPEAGALIREFLSSGGAGSSWMTVIS